MLVMMISYKNYDIAKYSKDDFDNANKIEVVVLE